MQMIGISTDTFHDTAFLLIKNAQRNTKVDDVGRRMSRTATLDGASDFDDMGYSVADRVFDIRVTGLSVDDYNILRLRVKTYTLIVITTEEGCFRGAPDRLTQERGDITYLRVLIKEVLS